MAQGLALTIGLNSVNPSHYQGWSGPLNACEADADDMADMAISRGFTCTKLLTKDGSRAAVKSVLADAARRLKAGDIFFLTYSGHGGQLPDLNGDEADRNDETWCLYDGELVDDELYTAFGAFAAGVRIIMLSDSCHSGTVSKDFYYRKQASAGAPVAYRAMPNEVALRVYQKNKEFYDPILKARDTAKALAAVKASILLISGCHDNQLSLDGTFNGLFTGTMKSVWNGGTFEGSYTRFHKAIRSKMPPDQTPQLSMVGTIDRRFTAQTPFTI
ncbi:MAG: caspase family protein [Telluria sp.]